MTIAAVYISPLFNGYRPLEPGPLKDEILVIARANRVPAENVYQFDASKQSSLISANVSGFDFIQWSFPKIVRPDWGVRDVSDVAGLPESN